MSKPKTRMQVKSKLCAGCYNNRYNNKDTCERPGIDAVVTSNFCWFNDPRDAMYDRRAKEWKMPCHSGNKH